MRFGRPVTNLLWIFTRQLKIFPKHEFFGITSQIRRASSSVGLNISEGCGRESDIDFRRYLLIAYGSLDETDYCIILSKDLNYLTKEKADELSAKVLSTKMMLGKLINKLLKDNTK